MNRAFDVLRGMLDLHIAVANEFFERAQRVLLLVLRLNLDRRAVVQRHGAPAERLHIFHCQFEQFFVGQSIRKRLDNEIARLVLSNGGL